MTQIDPPCAGRSCSETGTREARPALLETIVSKLAADSRKSRFIAVAFLAVLTIELAAAIAAAGCPTLNAMVWDVATMLDGGWRLLNGQKPHVDFYSPLGLLPLLIVAGGMKIGSPSASAFAYSQAILLPVLTLWAWALLRTRTSAFFSGAVAFWIGVLAVAPRSLGYAPPLVSYSMQYNRWGWALMLIACIELFVPPRAGKSGALAAASTGVVAGLLLFLKLNYFGAVIIAIAIRLVLSGVDRKWLTCAAGALAGVAGAGFWYLNFDLGAFSGDLKLLASVQHPLTRVFTVVQLLFGNAPDFWLLASAILAAGLSISRSRGWKSAAHLLAVPVSLAVLGILVCSANFQMFEIPLTAFAVFCVAEQLRPHLQRGGDPTKIGYVAVCLMALAIIGNTLYRDLATLAAASSSPAKDEAWTRFDAGPLRDLKVEGAPKGVTPDSVRLALRAGAVPWREESGEAYPYVLWLNDGVHLLKDHSGAKSRVVVLDLSNPFSFALGLTPPRGDALFWQYKQTFDATHFPPPEKIFREVTLVMVPKVPISKASAIILHRVYSRVLASEFQRVAESDLWILYERTAARQPS